MTISPNLKFIFADLKLKYKQYQGSVKYIKISDCGHLRQLSQLFLNSSSNASF